MMVKGTARLDMKSGKPITLQPGGYAMLPSKHVHQFLCTNSCLFYVHSESTFDTHYVDGQGKEVPPEEALKSVKHKTSKAAK
jgi:quercetin dioxygenase-like cupin family protein